MGDFMFEIEVTKNPKWFQLRKQLARFLVFLSKKVEPKNEYVYAKFLSEMMKAQLDAITYGTGCIKIEHIPFNKTQKGPSDE
jgi:hypothetical protein